MIDEVLTKSFTFDPLKTISQSKNNSKVRNGSGLKSVTSGFNVLISFGRRFTFLHLLETKQQIYDAKQNNSRCRLIPNYVFSFKSNLGEDGLSVLVNLIKSEIECIYDCGERNVSTRIELKNSAYTIFMEKQSSKDPTIGESVLVEAGDLQNF